MGERQEAAGVRIAHRAGARVSVELCWDALVPTIEVRFAPHGPEAPGPEVTATWEQAVVAGVRHALATARALPCDVRVTEVCGPPDHGRPTLFAAAAAWAVWEALEFEPPREVAARWRGWVAECSTREPLWLPDL